MKVLRLITTVLITICVLLVGFFAFRLSTAGKEMISIGMTLLYIFFILLVLFSYRLTLAGHNEKITIPSLLVLMIILGLSIMYFSRETIPSLWGYTLAGFITLQGINLLPRVQNKTKLQVATHIMIIVSTLGLASMCIIKVNAGFLFTAAMILLTITSLLSITENILRKND